MFRTLTVHEDVDKQYLHGVQRVAQPQHSAQCNKRQRSRGRAKLERKEVLDVVEDGLAYPPVSQSAFSTKENTHPLK